VGVTPDEVAVRFGMGDVMWTTQQGQLSLPSLWGR